jgi:D-alanine transaminase/branched-chain amino acid aminotransferase
VDQYVFLNDAFIEHNEAKLHISDLSIQRGYGIFDYLKIIEGVPIFIDDHLQRFYNSAKAMHLPLLITKEELRSTIKKLINKNDIPVSGMRISLTGGYSVDGYTLDSSNLFITQHILQLPSEEVFDKGLKLMSFEHQRQLPFIKTIDYLKAIWLQPLLRKATSDDVLYFTDNSITECPRANFFIVLNGNIIVTPANHILNGVTRMKILELAQKGFRIEVRDVLLSEIKDANEAFITSTTKGILPVLQIDDHVISKTPGAVTKTLSAFLKDAIQKYQDLYSD